MDIKAIIAALAKIPGAEDHAASLGKEVAGLTDRVEAAEGKLATVTTERDTLKADVKKWKAEAESTNKDETVKKTAAERDEYKTKFEAAEKRQADVKLSEAIGEALGISDKAARKAAAEHFMRTMPEGVTLSAKGDKLLGAAKAIESFKDEHTFYFLDAAGAKSEGDASGERGGGTTKQKPFGGSADKKVDSTADDKKKSWEATLYGKTDADTKAAADKK